MGLVDFFRGYSTMRKIEAVFDKDGNRGPLYVMTEHFDDKGILFMSSIGGRLTRTEKRIYAENPKLVGRSPFSYTPESELNLPREFARTMRRFNDDRSSRSA